MPLGPELVAVACPSVGTNAILPRIMRSCIVLRSPNSLAGKVTRFRAGYDLSIWAFSDQQNLESIAESTRADVENRHGGGTRDRRIISILILIIPSVDSVI